MTDNKRFTCWIVSEGIAGTENQCIGVAEQLEQLINMDTTIKRIQLTQPWKTLSPYLGFETLSSFAPPLTPPWPDILITSGRKAIAASRYIKKQSGGRTFTLHIQDPRISAKAFDLLAVPAHDPARGHNVIVTTAAANRITEERLQEARTAFAQFKTVRSPRVAVLIGGSSQAYEMTEEITRTLAEQLARLDAGLMVTASRRTGEANKKILSDALSGTDAYVWDGNGENPYFGFLAWADYILVTADSVSMLSEAGTTGKPVYMIPLKGGGRRLDTLHKNLMHAGVVRVFEGKLEHWDYEPLADARQIACETQNRFEIHLENPAWEIRG